MSITKQTCPTCAGKGWLAAANALRARRIASGKSLRDVAKAMGFSAPYISDLERGRRAWNARLQAAFMEATK